MEIAQQEAITGGVLGDPSNAGRFEGKLRDEIIQLLEF